MRLLRSPRNASGLRRQRTGLLTCARLSHLPNSMPQGLPSVAPRSLPKPRKRAWLKPCLNDEHPGMKRSQLRGSGGLSPPSRASWRLLFWLWAAYRSHSPRILKLLSVTSTFIAAAEGEVKEVFEASRSPQSLPITTTPICRLRQFCRSEPRPHRICIRPNRHE